MLLLLVFQILQVTTLLVSEEEQNILYYIFLLHPTYGWVEFAEHRHSFIEFAFNSSILHVYNQTNELIHNCYYSLGNGLADMYTNQLYKDICTKNELFER